LFETFGRLVYGILTSRLPGDVVDLGCAFRLSVSPVAGTSVSVESGWVLLSNVHGEATVPAGASSVMPPGEAPLVPVFDDATEAFRRGSRAIDAAARLSPPPADLDLSAVAAGDRERLWAWIDRLDLAPAKQWWRHWRDGFQD
jgi:hypothetical protein